MSHPVELRFFHVLALSELTLQLDQSSHRQSQTKSKDLKTNCNLKKRNKLGGPTMIQLQQSVRRGFLVSQSVIWSGAFLFSKVSDVSEEQELTALLSARFASICPLFSSLLETGVPFFVVFGVVSTAIMALMFLSTAS